MQNESLASFFSNYINLDLQTLKCHLLHRFPLNLSLKSSAVVIPTNWTFYYPRQLRSVCELGNEFVPSSLVGYENVNSGVHASLESFLPLQVSIQRHSALFLAFFSISHFTTHACMILYDLIVACICFSWLHLMERSVKIFSPSLDMLCVLHFLFFQVSSPMITVFLYRGWQKVVHLIDIFIPQTLMVKF